MGEQQQGREPAGVIESLKSGEIFVFGSNAEGQHLGGAARQAVEQFGAVMGQGEGLQGDSYAIPTMEGLDALAAAVGRFLAFARATPQSRFLVTAIGIGIAGHAAADIAPLFRGAPANVVLPEAFQLPVVAYKGFDANMQCRGLQYAVGQTVLHTGPVKHCQSGLHACENPIDVFGYYPPSTSRFALVELSGSISREENGDSKVAAAQLTVKAELKIPELVAACIEWVTKVCNPATSNHATGDRSASSATGDQSASSATGYQSASSATGYQSASSATGYQSASSATGDRSASSATGDRSASSATGDQSASSATGYQSASSATGYQSASSATGYQSASSATGDRSASSATGDRSASSATGDQSASSATGDRSASSATGDQSASSVSGKGSVAMSIGRFSSSKADEDGAIVCVYRDDDWNLVHIRASKVGENGIKPNVSYTLDAAGQFVEVAEVSA